MDTTNSSTAASPLACFLQTENSITIKTVVYTVILVLSLSGNVFAITNVSRRRGQCINTTYILIMNMAISDMFVPLLVMPREVFEAIARTPAWRIHGSAGEALCKILFFLTDISPLVSILSLCGITIERFGAVVKPFKYSLPTKQRIMKGFIAATWLVPIAFVAHYLHSFQLVPWRDEFYCIIKMDPTSHRIYAIVVCVSFYVMPFTLMTLLYAAIIRQLRKPPFRPRNQAVPQAPPQRRNVHKLTKLAVWVVMAFLLCWSPFYLGVFASLFHPGWLGNACNMETYWFVAKSLAYANAAVNPWIYYCFVNNGQHIRKLLRRISTYTRSSRRRRLRVGVVDERV